MQHNLQSDSQQWQLFGLDLSRVARYLRAGWYELLWGESAGLRRRMDTPVELLHEDGSRRLYVAEHPLAAGASADSRLGIFRAMQFPSDKVLFRHLRLPKVLELELDNAIALEVRTHSPFPADNSIHGWRLCAREGEFIDISLAIAARDEVMAWVHKRVHKEPHKEKEQQKATLPEVWVKDDAGRILVLQGFGEQQRYKAYPRRVATTAVKLAFVAVCILILLALPGMVRELQSVRMETHFNSAQQDAAEALALREALVLGNNRVQELQIILDESVDYHVLLEHISRQTPDDVYIETMRMDGARLRLAGQAVNALVYMQLLREDPLFAEVQTPSAFSRDRRSGLERFFLEIRVAQRVPGEE